jgi:hypothetical protein
MEDTNEMDTNEMDTNEMDTNEMDTNEMDTNEMDTNEMERLMKEFKSRADTHPELSAVWYNYLKKQNQKIHSLISQGNSVINSMDAIPDISIKSIILYSTFTSLQF